MKKFGLVFLLLAGLCLTACISPGVSTDNLEKMTASTVGLYNLQHLDPLIISLLGIPVEKQFETTIDENGQITMPYLDDAIQAAGLSVSALEREIQRLYTEGEIYRNVTVNIQTDAKTYFMEGEVNRPQEYPLNRRITLLQAIAAASGYTEYADKKDITITRRGEIIKANGKEIEKYPERDIAIEAGDRIKVDRTFY